MAKKFRLTKRNVSLLVSLVVAVATLGQQMGWWGSAGVAPPSDSASTSQSESISYRVDSVVDGDTIRIVADGANGGYKTASGTETVRLIGVDTPETRAPNKPVQCFGREASAYLKQLLIDPAGVGTVVKLAADPQNDDRDRYRRLLRYVYLADGRLVQAELLKSGHAFAYTTYPFGQSDAFVSMQLEAQTSKRGLWAVCKPIVSGSGSYTSNPAE